MKRKRKPGGGRKPAPYKTTTVSVRVRTEWVEDVKEAITQTVNELKQQDMNIGNAYTEYVINYRKQNGNTAGCLSLAEYSAMVRGCMKI